MQLSGPGRKDGAAHAFEMQAFHMDGQLDPRCGQNWKGSETQRLLDRVHPRRGAPEGIKSGFDPGTYHRFVVSNITIDMTLVHR